MRTILTGGSLILWLLLVVAAPSAAAPGDLDPTFGDEGFVTTTVSEGSDIAFAVAVQPDGKIVVAGDASPYPARTFALTRYASDGTLDPSFGTDGVVLTDFGEGSNNGHAVVLQPDGKIVVAGGATVGGVQRFALARYDASGSLDPSFGSGGLVTTGLAGSARAVGLQPDGKLVVAGPSGGDFGLARYAADGTLDPSFGSGGTATVDIGNTDTAQDLALQADGKIVVVGSTSEGRPGFDPQELAVARFETGGTLDASFGVGGVVVTGTIGTQVAAANGLGVAVQADGAIVVAGFSNHPQTGGNFLVARYLSDGTLDPGFGAGDGVVTTDFGSGSDVAFDVLIEPDGAIVAAGRASLPAFENGFALARYEPDGTLQSAFGVRGLVTTDLAPKLDDARAVALQPDLKLVAAGRVDSPGYVSDFAVVRYDGGSALACAPAPLAGCKATGPGRSKLALADDPTGKRERLSWKWSRGDAVAAAELGDPVGGDDYVACLYDESGAAPALVLHATAPGGGTCAGKPCWKGTGRPRGTTGAKYKDKRRTPNGVDSVKPRVGAAGKAKVVVQAKGPNLQDLGPLLPLSLPVRLQLQSDGGTCWEAAFSAPAQRNDALRFRDRSD